MQPLLADTLTPARNYWVASGINLIYTGITRDKRLLVLVGQKKALGHRCPQ